MPASDRLGWFRFNPTDLIADPAVQGMRDDQLGKYLRVLCAMYTRNSGVASEEEVRAWARCPGPEWEHHREVLARAFKVGRDGRWKQRRVVAEVRAAKMRVRRAQKSGRVGARQRWASVALLQQRDG